MKLWNKIIGVFIGLSMALGVGVIFNIKEPVQVNATSTEEVVFTLEDFSGGSSQYTSPITATKDDITVSADGGYLPASGHFRVGKNKTLSVDAGDKVIDSIAITFTGTNYDGGWATNYVSINASTWSQANGNAEIIRISRFAVNIIVSGGGDDPQPIEPPNLFTQITTTADITDGKYLIVYDNVCFDGSLDTLDVVGNTKEVSLANLLTSYWTITNGEVKSASGLYIGQATDTNGLTQSETALPNTVSIDGEGNLDILSHGGAHLRYNSASNQLRFRYYKSVSYTGQKAIQLYKVNLDAAILDEITCDATGATPPQGSWSNLKTYYNTLSTTDKNTLKTAVGDGLARYDYIVGKYGTEVYEDFIGRNPASLSAKGWMINPVSETNTIPVIIIVSIAAITAIGIVITLKRKKVN